MSTRPLDPLLLPLSGTQLIEASAGTGKTYTITSLVLRLLLERGLGVDQIAVVTFTKAATSELRDRIRRRIDEAERAFATGKAPEGDALLQGLLLNQRNHGQALSRLRSAQRALDRAAIFTIHGFAQRMLQEHAFESGARFDLELVGDQRTLVTEVAHDFWANEIATLPDAIWRLLEPRGVRLASFVALGYVAAAWPDLPLHAAPRASVDALGLAEQSHGALQAALRRAALVYRNGGSEALALVSPTALNAKYYSFEKIARYREELEELLSCAVPSSSELPAAVDYLSSEALTRWTKKGHTPPAHPLFDALVGVREAFRAAENSADELLNVLRARMVEFARRRVVQEHEHAGTQSFDGLLHGLGAALRGKSAAALARRMRQRYPAALIDEFQDTDPTQYDIFRRVYAAGETSDESPALFLIGDPKQAIYAFRGADVFAYLAAARDAADGAWTLTTNFRSDPGLLSAQNTLFGRLERPFLLESIQYNAVHAPASRGDRLFRTTKRGTERVTPLEVLYLDRATAGATGHAWSGVKEWAFLAAQEIARLLASGATLEEGGRSRPIAPGDIAVLTRTNRQAQDIQEHLRALLVPSVLSGDRTVFETEEAEELRRIMRALAEPTSASALRTAIATRFLNADASLIASLEEDESAWEAWVARFREGNTLWVQSGFVHAVEHLFRELEVIASTLAVVGGERRLTNLRHLVELLHGAEKSLHLGVVGLLQWFDEARRDPSGQGMAPEAQQLRLESDADSVTLTTMHKSKGLEYPIVVVPFLGAPSDPFQSEKDNLRFHDPKAGERLALDVRIPAHKPKELEIGLEEYQAETLRLAYVGLTRAKHHLLVFWGGVGGAFSPLGYLLHQPASSLGGLDVNVATRLKGMDDAARWAELEELSARSGGTLGVRRATLEAGPAFRRADEGSSARLAARRLARRVPQGTRTSSFSAMTRGSHVALSRQASAGRDVDDLGMFVESNEAGETALSTSSSAQVVLAEFPRGAAPGELLHSVFEHGLGETDPVVRAAIAERELKRHGFDERHLDSLRQAVEDVLATPLVAASDVRAPEAEAWTLGALTPAAFVAEMEFVLPVAARAEGRLLTAAQLAAALSEERPAEEAPAESGARGRAGGAPWDARYVEQVARLDFQAWAGFLRGFMDLVFERDGRFYVLDYKSNHLGVHADDYRVERLSEVMAEHHYYLQYLLYSVALHRHLAQRIAGYDYDAHFGGAYYLFVRGMQPSTGPRRGVFFHRPARRLIERLSALLDDPLLDSDRAGASASEAAR